jgi:hypothetical protein
LSFRDDRTTPTFHPSFDSPRTVILSAAKDQLSCNERRAFDVPSGIRATVIDRRYIVESRFRDPGAEPTPGYLGSRE